MTIPNSAGTPHERLLFLTAHLQGRHVTVTTKDGKQYDGVFKASPPEDKFSVVLGWARLKVKPDAIVPKPIKELKIGAADFASVVAFDVDLFEDEAGAVRNKGEVLADTEIEVGGRGAGQDRELQKVASAWLTADADGGLGGGGGLTGLSGNWDQFAQNQARFGVKSSYNEELYTTKLSNQKFTKAQREEAARLAAEIESKPATSAHVAEERGQQEEGDDDMDEEDKFSTVIRDDVGKMPAWGQPSAAAAAAQPGAAAAGAAPSDGAAAAAPAAAAAAAAPAAAAPAAAAKGPTKLRATAATFVPGGGAFTPKSFAPAAPGYGSPMQPGAGGAGGYPPQMMAGGPGMAPAQGPGGPATPEQQQMQHQIMMQQQQVYQMQMQQNAMMAQQHGQRMMMMNGVRPMVPMGPGGVPMMQGGMPMQGGPGMQGYPGGPNGMRPGMQGGPPMGPGGGPGGMARPMGPGQGAPPRPPQGGGYPQHMQQQQQQRPPPPGYPQQQ